MARKKSTLSLFQSLFQSLSLSFTHTRTRTFPSSDSRSIGRAAGSNKCHSPLTPMVTLKAANC
jgi:hypothetical protein